MDIELLICMVRDRPVLWDKTCAEYKSKDHSRDAWIEICIAFVPDFHTMNPTEQETLQETLMRKWINIRDSWMKWRKKLNGKKRVKNYIYSTKLEFLKTVLPYSDIDCESKGIKFQKTSQINNSPIVQPNLSVPPPLPAKSLSLPLPVHLPPTSLDVLPSPKRIATDCVKSQEKSQTNNSPIVQPNLSAPVNSQSSNLLVQCQSHPLRLQPTSLNVIPPPKQIAMDCRYTNSTQTENRHLSFFKSVLPSMACFSDDETLEFQMGVLSAIQCIKRTRKLKM